MKTIGSLFKEERLARGLTLSDIEKNTKIRAGFVGLIEKEDWNSLPEYPVVFGFVKNIASFLEIDEKKAIAILRRDYPPKKISLNPKPDLKSEFRWSPRLTFLAGVVIILSIIFGYLGFQYIKFTFPPALSVEKPKEGQIVTENIIEVFGNTDPGATVKINNQPALVGDKGSFRAEIEVLKGEFEIVVVARSRSGKETLLRRKIVYR